MAPAGCCFLLRFQCILLLNDLLFAIFDTPGAADSDRLYIRCPMHAHSSSAAGSAFLLHHSRRFSLCSYSFLHDILSSKHVRLPTNLSFPSLLWFFDG